VSYDSNLIALCNRFRSPDRRPSSGQVCGHPFFWSWARRLEFLVELSDRLEQETPDSPVMLALESGTYEALGTRAGWTRKLDSVLLEEGNKYRKYDESSVRELLRLIRNKRHHYHELSEVAKATVGALPNGFCLYFMSRFPKLLLHCVRVACTYLSMDPHLRPFVQVIEPLFKQPPITASRTPGTPVADTSNNEEAVPTGFTSVAASEDCGLITDSSASSSAFDDVPMDDGSLNVVMWHKSQIANSYQCSGWWRDEQSWTTSVSKKRPPHYDKAVAEPRYRTQLCSHWVNSGGSNCPMRSKGKCIFAHGPTELRLKECRKDKYNKILFPDALGAASSLLKKFNTPM
jgi:hypothetical protein